MSCSALLWSGSYTGPVYSQGVMLTPDKLRRIHESLLLEPPQPIHNTLYDAFPRCCGFDDSALDTPKFEAVFILGIAQTYPLGGQQFHHVALIVSGHAETWAVNRMREMIKQVFDRLKDEMGLKAAKIVGTALDHLLMGTRALQIAEPPRWASFGFKSQDPIPEWMSSRLL